MKLTITNDQKEESEDMVLIPEELYDDIVSDLRDLGLFPAPRRTTTVGAEQNTPTASWSCKKCGNGNISSAKKCNWCDTPFS